MNRPCVVTIAGSDSGGGAGIQADLKAIASLGVHGASVICAVTAQNSRAVTDVLTLPDAIVESQLDAVFSDLQPAVAKIGMLGNARIVELVARKLEQWKPGAIVLDPVMVASSGARLLEEDAIEAVRTRLIPLATVVTPNWFEIAEIIEATPRGPEDFERIALSFKRLGARAVLIKGGHLPGDTVIDTLWDGEAFTEFAHPRIHEAESHGTGCTLASAIAAGLARGNDLVSACRDAADLVHAALERRYATGASRAVYLGVFGSEG